MRYIYTFLTVYFISLSVFSQTSQQYIGASGVNSVLNATKINATDLTRISVGYVNNPPSGSGNDLFLVKMNSANQILWQKTIINPGNDFLAKVIICANGDYAIIGKLYQAGIPRGYIARVNSQTGNVIWSMTTQVGGSQFGDELFDIIETATGNFCVVGINDFTAPYSDGLAIMLNSNGTQLWAKVSNLFGSDGFSSVVQLPNGNLLINGLYIAGSNYNCDVLELNVSTGALVNEYLYSISTSITAVGAFVNSMWPSKSYIKNGQIYFSMIVFQGFGSNSSQFLSKFDPVTKIITGNVYTHAPNVEANGYSFFPIADNDVISIQSYSGSNAFVSRITNGSIVYQRKLSTQIESIHDVDVVGNDLMITGGFYSGPTTNGYVLSSTINLPESSSPCSIPNVNSLAIQPISLNPTNSIAVNIEDINTINTFAGAFSNSNLTVNILCGCPAAVAITTQPANANLCGSGNVSFSIASTNQTSIQWQLNTGTGWNDIINNATYTGVNTNTLSVTGANAAMNNYLYRAVISNSCGSVNSNAGTLLVSTPVTPSISISASSNNICTGTSVTFTAAAVNGGATPTYQWKKNGANVGANQNTYVSNTLANGDIISCVLTSGISCVTAATASSNGITMNVTPLVTPSASIIASANNICAGTLVTFTASAINGGTTPAYQWKKNGTNVGSNQNTYSNNALANGDIITCVITSSITCVTSASATSNAIAMLVNPVVTPGVTIAVSANDICTNTNVTFTATTINAGTNPVYQWKLNGGNVGTNATVYTNNNLATGDVVSFAMVSNAACVTTANAVSNSITMRVLPTVTPSISISIPANNICAGTNVTFTAVAVNAGSAPIYQWKKNNVNVGTNSSTYSSTTLATGDMIFCELTSNANCLTTPNAQSNSITMTVISTGQSNIRYPSVTTFINQPLQLQAREILQSQYTWVPAIGLNNAGISNPIFTYTQDQNFLIKIKLSNGCTITDSLLVKVIKETGIYVPTAFSPNGSNRTLYPFLVGIKQLKFFKIYNRWGNILFQTTSGNPASGWNGTFNGALQPVETYTWVAEGVDVNGVTIKRGGNTMLIR